MFRLAMFRSALTLIGLLVSAQAAYAIPQKKTAVGRVTDDTALHQELSEIRVRKAKPNLHRGMKPLGRLENRYSRQDNHKLAAHPRLKKVIARVLKTPKARSKALRIDRPSN